MARKSVENPKIGLEVLVRYNFEESREKSAKPLSPLSMDKWMDDETVQLPAWFVPSKLDVICGWARQNEHHGKKQKQKQNEPHLPWNSSLNRI